MKVQVLTRPSMNSAFSCLLIRNVTQGIGGEFAYKECTKREIADLLDPQADVVILIGFSYYQGSYYDEELMEKLDSDWGYPFSECLWVSNYGDDVTAKAVTHLRACEDKQSLIRMLFSTLNKHPFFSSALDSYGIIAPVHEYYTTGQGNDGVVCCELFNMYGMSLVDELAYKTLPQITQEHLPVLLNQLRNRTTYLTKKVQSAVVRTAFRESEPLNIYVIGADRYHNEIAQHLLDKLEGTVEPVIIVLISRDGEKERYTFRSRGVNCLEIAKLFDENAKGQPYATTVWVNTVSAESLVGDVLAETLDKLPSKANLLSV
ncbi:exopolyphosphatase [Brochothrix phage BtpYZU04]